MTKEKTTSYRLGQMTLNQIDSLAESTGMSKANVVQTAIDRMYQQETQTMNYTNQEKPAHPKPDYSSDPITKLAHDIYQEALRRG